MQAEEIRFKGKRVDTQEWVYGFLIKTEDGKHYIFNYWRIPEESTPSHHFIEVIPESVGQYLGYIDDNGIKIYSGDIVRYTQHYFNTDKTSIKHKVVEWNICETKAGETNFYIVGNRSDDLSELLSEGRCLNRFNNFDNPVGHWCAGCKFSSQCNNLKTK